MERMVYLSIELLVFVAFYSMSLMQEIFPLFRKEQRIFSEFVHPGDECNKNSES